MPQADGHDALWLVDKRVPGIAAVINDIVGGLEDAVRRPVVAHELPQVLDGVELVAREKRWSPQRCGVFVKTKYSESQGFGRLGQKACDFARPHAWGLPLEIGL
ncbi:hypothetical protein GGQ88_004229 [Novosphingobium hassiacum]|uniref:Uncharacterized protein n=1 Tax=Novosphingobium hassiacum TaxID=173676 RepID=A0A7W5ZZJ6_9SPHN|nr:hypothetical protein [Novosphingobium hassiacum]